VAKLHPRIRGAWLDEQDVGQEHTLAIAARYAPGSLRQRRPALAVSFLGDDAGHLALEFGDVVAGALEDLCKRRLLRGGARGPQSCDHDDAADGGARSHGFTTGASFSSTVTVNRRKLA